MLFEPNSPGINKLTRRYKASTTNPNLEALHNDASPLANEKDRRLPWSDATHLDLLWILNLPDRHVVVPRPVTAICTRRLKLCRSLHPPSLVLNWHYRCIVMLCTGTCANDLPMPLQQHGVDFAGSWALDEPACQGHEVCQSPNTMFKQ